MTRWLEDRARAMSLATARDPVTQIDVHARWQAEFACLLVTSTTLNVSTTTQGQLVKLQLSSSNIICYLYGRNNE